jgi:hypothetical protein
MLSCNITRKKEIKLSLPELFKILSICENQHMCKMCHARAQYKINFDRPPRLKKLPEALIISPELRHLYIHTYIHTYTHTYRQTLKTQIEVIHKQLKQTCPIL